MSNNLELKSKEKLKITDLLINSFIRLKENVLDIIIIMCIFTLVPTILLVIIIKPLITTLVLGILFHSTVVSIGIIGVIVLANCIISILYVVGGVSIVKLINEREKSKKYPMSESVKFALSKFTTVTVYCLVLCLISSIMLTGSTLLVVAFINTLKLKYIMLLIVGCIGMCIFSLVVIFSIQAISLKELEAIDSLKYSIQMVRVRFANVFLKIFILGVVCGILTYIVKYLLGDNMLAYIIETVIIYTITGYKLIYKSLMFIDYEDDDYKIFKFK